MCGANVGVRNRRYRRHVLERLDREGNPLARVLKNLVHAASTRRRTRLVLVAAVLVLSAAAAAVLGGSTRSSSPHRPVNRQPAAATSGPAPRFPAVRAAGH